MYIPANHMGSKHVLFINGSLRGEHGNTGLLLREARRRLPATLEARDLVLAEYGGSTELLAETVRQADAFVIGSGIYWGNWGSPLQRFLEVMTAYEVTDHFMGKPVAVLATMDSVGGSDMAQRLLGVFSNLGCMIPPLANLVMSRVGVMPRGQPVDDDVWQLKDLEPVMKNLALATELGRLPWYTWPVAEMEPMTGPYPAAGVLLDGLPCFVGEAPGALPVAPAVEPILQVVGID